jgi:hypothetical protein
MTKTRLTFDLSLFSRPTMYLPTYTPPEVALPEATTRAGRAELHSLQQRWLMWEAAGVPVRDVEALKWFAVKWINRDINGKTKKEVEATGGSFSYSYMSEVLQRLEKLAGGALPLGARRACEQAMNPFIAARGKAAEERRKAAKEAKPTPLGMDPESKVRLRLYEQMMTCAKEAFTQARFRAPAGKGDRSPKSGITYARCGTRANDFRIDNDEAAERAKRGKCAVTVPSLYWERKGTGSKRPLELTFNVTPHWYFKVGKPGLAGLFGEETLVLAVRPNANGVPEYLVARQKPKGAVIEFVWGIRSLGKDNEVVLKKVVEKTHIDNPTRLYK